VVLKHFPLNNKKWF